MEDLTKYTFFIDGEPKACHIAEPFSDSVLQQALQMILKETSLYNTDCCKSGFKHTGFFGKVFTKVFKFLFKFQKFLLVKFLTCNKTASNLHIVSLCVEYDVEVSSEEVFYGTKPDVLKMIKEANNRIIVYRKEAGQ